MKRLYIRDPEKNYAFVSVGWICLNCGKIKLKEDCIQKDCTATNVYNSKRGELMYTIPFDS